ncbi:unnamed protein product [Trichobilharzia szidati]|nr:unnamed protein product [Trichobilharzia szidati]
MAGSRWQIAAAPAGKVGNSSREKQVIFEPTFSNLEKKSYGSTQRLKQAFYKVEKKYPGFSEDFLIGLLQQLRVDNEMDMTESSLRIAALVEYDSSKYPVILALWSWNLQLKQ